MRIKSDSKPLWLKPWGFSEGFIATAGLLVVSVFLERIIPFSLLPKPKFPINLLIFTALIFALILLWYKGRKSIFFQWLASVKVAIPAISFFTLIVLLMGIIPQKTHSYGIPFGLFNILSTWMFFFSIMFILITLGASTVNRIYPVNLRNITFFLNHFGLWICLAAGYFGSADKQEATLQVNRGDVVWYGETDHNQNVELPIAIELKNFKAEFHQPRIVLVGGSVKSANSENELSQLPLISIDNLNIKIEQYLPKAFPADTSFIDARGVPFTGSAVRVLVTDCYGGYIAKGWLAYPTRVASERNLSLPDGRFLRLLSPEPAYFGSEIKLYAKKSESLKEGIVEVNSPMRIDGWWVYQYSYDNFAGADSRYSVFRAVFDPWMPVIYAGFILMLIGVALMVFIYPLKFK